MNHLTSIGLDVYAHSIVCASLDPLTGVIKTARFSYCAADVAQWISQFENPRAVYESAVTGFDLARSLRSLGIDCRVCASSKLQRPPADRRKKNDENDAVFLARILSIHNITEVFVPDEETEACPNLVRAYDHMKQDLLRASQCLDYVFDKTWLYL